MASHRQVAVSFYPPEMQEYVRKMIDSFKFDQNEAGLVEIGGTAGDMANFKQELGVQGKV